MENSKPKIFLKNLIQKKSFRFLLLLILLYKIIFNQFTGQFLVNKISSSLETISFRSEVKTFSLFFGIEVRNLFLGVNGETTSILEADRVALKYNLPLLLLGKVKVSEIALISPKIHLIEKDGKLNLEKIIPESKEKKIEEETEPLTEISTYLPISAYLSINIESLSFIYDRLDVKKEIHSSVSPITLKLLLDTERFRKIPLDISILYLIDRLKLELNPGTDTKIVFETKDLKLSHPIQMRANVQKENSGKDLQLVGKIIVSIQDLIPIRKGKPLSKIFARLGVDLEYKPEGDSIQLDELSLDILGDKWLLANGKATNLQKKDRYLDLKLENTKIEFAKINSIWKEYPELPQLKLGGFFEIFPSQVSGKFESLDSKIKLGGKNIFFQIGNGKSHSIPELKLDVSGNLNLNEEKEKREYASLPFVNSIYINELKVGYNRILASLKGKYQKEETIDLNLDLQNLVLSDFVPSLTGVLTANLNLKGKNLGSVFGELKAKLNNFQYSVSGSRANRSHLKLNLRTELGLLPSFMPSFINISALGLKIDNYNLQEGLSASLKGRVSKLSPIQLSINELNLKIDQIKFYPILPFSLMEKISILRTYLGNDLNVNGNLKVDFTKTKKVSGELGMSLPNLQMKDFKTDFAIDLDSDSKGTLKIDRFNFVAYRSLLKGAINGTLTKAENGALGGFKPDLNLQVGLASKTQSEITNMAKFDGNAGITLKIQENLARGKLYSENSNIFLGFGCPGPSCKPYLITGINIDLPIEHDLTKTITEKITEGGKSRFIKNYGFDKKPNFTIFRVLGPHPFQEANYFEYMKPSGEIPAFQGNFEYIRNIFSLNNLKITFLNGTLYGKDILFNVGNGKPESMEYAATIQIKDIDLKELLSEKIRSKIDDGKIKADLNLLGTNLTDPITNTEIYFSIYQIGSDFARSAINVVSPPSTIRDNIINRYAVEKLEATLSRGLVYTTINFESSYLSALLPRIENNKISQERMPLANFLNRANSEISNYK
ncbi:MAG: hypothetical protein SFU98_12090 [Leptospiraceae bacterium]|nr:hypothetical protein [Leptospiraceae bacterium]